MLNIYHLPMRYEDSIHHIYNRGAHKALTFIEPSDYIRMQKLLYLANCPNPFKLREIQGDVFSTPRQSTLVHIVAYCLMPNHFHIALKGISLDQENKISKFMQKVCTGYTCYFNLKYGHSGTIWQGSYKNKATYDAAYESILVRYIHHNPLSLLNSDIPLDDKNDAEKTRLASAYEYSSLQDYQGILRAQRTILDSQV